jgi:hypothetical protein
MKISETRPCPASEDCGCVCRRLVARIVPGGVELKCRRCKRTMLVGLAGSYALARPQPEIALES